MIRGFLAGALTAALAVTGIAGVSYGLALLGHPDSVWWWRDVLGVL